VVTWALPRARGRSGDSVDSDECTLRGEKSWVGGGCVFVARVCAQATRPRRRGERSETGAKLWETCGVFHGQLCFSSSLDAKQPEAVAPHFSGEPQYVVHCRGSKCDLPNMDDADRMEGCEGPLQDSTVQNK
jgi:hypothetical protein